MWKRRAEIAVLALLVVLAGATGSPRRPHLQMTAPTIDLAGLAPERIDTLGDVGRVTLAATLLLLD
ncbi:hypothetical protein ASE86_05165 [Sphingomonas sp. Leaf33]|uniref:hypothetical protein n=1 Tax=Sphingomonas sp. Leaf33 TaxID=1736215 RepID=UPI0006F92E4D|nr:hypothetical protein [Sphingomonas sp. Leaf33]KQN25606.1 hypothetical protein ASE86_05165 [Sphingomonas sp. Leaf33]